MPRFSEGDKNEVDGLHEQVEPLNGDARLIDREPCGAPRCTRCGSSTRPAVPQNAKPIRPYLSRTVADLEAYATWCLCYDKWGAPNGDDDNWVRKYNRDLRGSRAVAQAVPGHVGFYRWLEWVAAEQLHAAQQAARQGRHEDRHHRRYGRRRASGRPTCGGIRSASPRAPRSALRRTCSTSKVRTGASRR